MTRRVMCGAAVLVTILCGIIVQAASRPSAADVDPHRLPSMLHETGLFAADGTIDPDNRAFAPQYPLWTDGMGKRRWIFLPSGSTIDGRNEHAWNFPVGTKLWKEFSLGYRKVETRLLWKVANDRWLAGTYVWNEDATAATLAPDEGVLDAVEVAPRRRHSIPGRTDCAACHGADRVRPLGFTALQLSTDRDPNAIHGAPVEAGMLTLASLVSDGSLVNSRADILSNPPRIRTQDPSTRAVLGYLSSNCGMCHDGSGAIAALGPVIRVQDLTEDGDRVAKTLVGHRTTWQVPGVQEGASVLVHPGSPELSALVVRMRSRSPSSQMPPLGTVIKDQEALDALTRWIAEGSARAQAASGAEPVRRQ